MISKVLLKSFEKTVYYVAEDKDDGPYMTKNEEPSKNDTLLFTSDNLFDAECYLCKCCENWFDGEEDNDDDYE
jgi:hypothetical protein